MDKIYCSKCGKKLTLKSVGDEGKTPYCIDCNKFFFDNPICSVLVAVINPNNEIILLKQNYVSKEYWVLVAGYLSKGETLEECTKREVLEETGLTVTECKYIKSYYHSKKGLIMAGFLAYSNETDYKSTSYEVDDLRWSKLEDALPLLKDGSIGKEHLLNIINKVKNEL